MLHQRNAKPPRNEADSHPLNTGCSALPHYNHIEQSSFRIGGATQRAFGRRLRVNLGLLLSKAKIVMSRPDPFFPSIALR